MQEEIRQRRKPNLTVARSEKREEPGFLDMTWILHKIVRRAKGIDELVVRTKDR